MKRRYTEIDIERIFDLDPGTISNSKGNDPCVGVLLQMIEACPFLIDVAKYGYDKRAARRILLIEAERISFP